MKLAPLRGGRKPEVQIAPLIDVIFLLLIFYAVTTQFVTDERLKLKLPEAKTAEEAGEGLDRRPPVVKVAVDGTVWIDDRLVSEDELEGRIQALVERSEDKSVILRGDRGADYGVVVHVLDLARAAGASTIQMAADKPPDAGPAP
jgi:biopolymer transport protein ExbD